MGNRTERFGFVTFDNDKDDLAFQDHRAFVADRISMDRLLRIATEAHTHTGEILSETPPAAPELAVSPAGGSLPPNQPIYYKVSVVDIYGQERLASAAAVAFTPPQIETPTAPTLRAERFGTLQPGDYQYALTATGANVDDETGMSNITTGSLVYPNTAWHIECPNLPSSATGWNIYRKGPTETGFQRIFHLHDGSNMTVDYDYARGPQRAPEENTTSTTNSIAVNPVVPLEPGQTCKIYRAWDIGDWDHSLVGWTNTLPFVDRGEPSLAGYPPDISAGVGGAPKIRIGTDTVGTLPPGLSTPTQTINFNIRGPVQLGYWPWQWVNELDTFYLLGIRANLGRDSAPDAQPVQVAIELRRSSDLVWNRYLYVLGPPILAEILAGQTTGPVTPFPDTATPGVHLLPGDALRVAVVQTGGGAGTDRDLTVTVLAAGRHGPSDSSDWSI